jgi:hypothetical protein
MPLMLARRASPCTACGGTLHSGEQIHYTQELGARHVEPACSALGTVRYRPNARAGTCSCGTHVRAGAGLLFHTPEGWAVRCTGCR